MSEAYTKGYTVIAFCSTDIVIHSLASFLKNKTEEPPVLCISDDGKVIVPLLGVEKGANELALHIATHLGTQASITTSIGRHFGINLLCPPDDLKLLNPEHYASFLSALLVDKKVKLKGHHDWFFKGTLPFSDTAQLTISVIDDNTNVDQYNENNLIYRCHSSSQGRLDIIGFGPGDHAHLTFAARKALYEATDILGYDYYIDLVGPFLTHQTLHKSFNRQEMERAKQALNLAASGKKIALISSGDPGVFAMAAAVMECMEDNKTSDWDNVSINIEPGVTAAQSAAACFGAPLGHDFSVISLSNNLKPWKVIEKRILAALHSDMAIAFYNPVSKARPDQLFEVISLLKSHCEKDRIINIATDIGRDGQKMNTTTIDEINTDNITSRSLIIIGSSQTRNFKMGDRLWTYTPRKYP
ncbi:precorrin-3B C(17)-methyltransferase [Bartonella tamiae]|nr:precorrin-3B C(17)-methyltransferase [Bartonella tamiae]